MSDVITEGPFQAFVPLNANIKVTRDTGQLEIAPAEISPAVSAVVNVMRIETFPTLPRHLKCSPFVCRFSADRSVELLRMDQNTLGITFTFDEGDNLIRLLELAGMKHKNMLSVNKVKRLGHTTRNPVDVIQ